MATPVLQIENLNVRFKTGDTVFHAVKAVNLQIMAGKTLAVVGESGSGKSLTALSTLKLLPEQAMVQGAVKLLLPGANAVDINTIPVEQLYQTRGRHIGMIFQEPMSSLNPVLTCGYQVAEVLMHHLKLDKKTAQAQTEAWFEKVKLPHPARIFKAYPHELSGGQKQRVMIAMAMCCKPALLIADEPTTALDVTVQKSIIELIQSLQAETQSAVMFITHDLGLVRDMADEVAVMQKGEVVEQGSVSAILQQPQHIYTKGLLSCRPPLDYRPERLLTLSDFQEGQEPIKPALKTSPDLSLHPAVLQVKDLSVWYPKEKNFFGRATAWIKAVDQVSFEVKKGETLGLVGESGCGKTTIGRAITRLCQIQSGQILYQNTDLAQLSEQAMRPYRPKMQLIFQDPYASLNPKMTIGAAIQEPMTVHGLHQNQADRKAKVMELLERVGLQNGHYNRYPHEFSGGQRQRIVIARALALEPEFLVCDESVSALDVSVQAQVLNLLSELKDAFNLSYIFISHDMAVVRFIADRIAVMQQGKIVEIGPAETIWNQAQHPYTKTLLEAIPGR
jgi:peptide/nickel transport system ATP-binding protein